MDPLHSPYTPGAGSPPQELVGRKRDIKVAEIAIGRAAAGRSVQHIVFIGLRGVGKTVLLNRLRLSAEDGDHAVAKIESDESRTPPELLVPPLRDALSGLSAVQRAKKFAQQGLEQLLRFAKRFKVKAHDIEIQVSDDEFGVDLQTELQALILSVARAAQSADKAVVIVIEELQYVSEPELGALITALHECAQRKLPVALITAGLPQLRGKLGKARSYAERLFDIREIDRIDDDSHGKRLSTLLPPNTWRTTITLSSKSSRKLMVIPISLKSGDHIAGRRRKKPDNARRC